VRVPSRAREDGLHQRPTDQPGHHGSAFLHALNRVLDEKLLEEAVARALAEIRAGQTTFPDWRLAAEPTLS
jgi:hypothetical protein